MIPDRYWDSFQRVVTAATTAKGDLSTELRKAIMARAAKLTGHAWGTEAPLESKLQALVDKVTRHAYKVTEEDFEGLKAAGYSEEAIFETILGTALGAAVARLQIAKAAIDGSR